jgi:hypothetical protein
MALGGQMGTFLQAASLAGKYTVPFDGVIVSWSYLAGSVTQPLRFKVGHPEGGTTFTIVGESGSTTPVASMLNTFGIRIPVRSGDVIGFYDANNAGCGTSGQSGYVLARASGDVPVGTPTNFPTMTAGGKLDLSANVETDCDNDGFGDESQDPDISSCNPDTAAPETTITKHPKNKTKKKTATFEFTADDPGAAFECSLDGEAFRDCSSPDTVKVKNGKHTFAVRATDVGGNVEGTPASDDWKVKKKKRKH